MSIGMKSLKLLRSAGGKRKGEEIKVSKGQADHLVAAGYAEVVEDEKPKAKASRKRPATSKGGGASPEAEAITAG